MRAAHRVLARRGDYGGDPMNCFKMRGLQRLIANLLRTASAHSWAAKAFEAAGVKAYMVPFQPILVNCPLPLL
jgi:hypothetical protein